jgi:hypothetical protein
VAFIPAISQPSNVSYTQGSTGHGLSWTITAREAATARYTIYLNGMQVATGSWTNGTPVMQVVDGLAADSYNYTLVATDGLGGMVQSTVIVRVVTSLVPSTPSTNELIAIGAAIAIGILAIVFAFGHIFFSRDRIDIRDRSIVIKIKEFHVSPQLAVTCKPESFLEDLPRREFSRPFFLEIQQGLHLNKFYILNYNLLKPFSISKDAKSEI